MEPPSLAAHPRRRRRAPLPGGSGNARRRQRGDLMKGQQVFVQHLGTRQPAVVISEYIDTGCERYPHIILHVPSAADDCTSSGQKLVDGAVPVWGGELLRDVTRGAR